MVARGWGVGLGWSVRLAVTSDLHFDHGRSRQLAEEVAGEISAAGREGRFDVLLVVGDTATSRGDALERGLERLAFEGPKLQTLGNHELWSDTGDTMELYDEVLPRRVRACGWVCLDQGPWVSGEVGVAGSVGWYDYGFAPEYLGIPRRFYEAKIAPGSAEYYTAYRHLLTPEDDIPPATRDIVARWNDGRYIRWEQTDVGFTELLLSRLEGQLAGLRGVSRVVCAVHHLPLRELLPPLMSPAWDFAKAYLGSSRFGELIGRYSNVSHVFSGHSHFPAEVEVNGKQFVATGSGYRKKAWRIVEV